MSERNRPISPVENPGGGRQFRIAAVNALADFERCVELQLAVWGYSDGDLMPKRVFIVAERIGGQVIGAFDRDVMVGFAMSLPGYRDGKPYLHSHMLAVLPEYRNAGLGRRLKLRLGAIVRRYLPNIYGPSTSQLQGGLPTDRLVAEWWLRSARVRRALGEEMAEVAGAVDISAQEVVQVTVPHAVTDWKQSADQRKLAETLQTRNRLVFESAFMHGLAVTGFERSSGGDGCYLLTPLSGLE
jgi:predicted GNAT superfamily acetyltransferase